MARLTVVGDAFLDVDVHGCSDRRMPDFGAPVIDERAVRCRPGGAGLAALLAARAGWTVRLVCALGDDPAGNHVRSMLVAAGVTVDDLVLDGRTPEKIRLFGDGVVVARLDRGGSPSLSVRERLGARLGGAVVVSDYGQGISADPLIRSELAEADLVVWDPHPRGTPPVTGVAVVTPNEEEARHFAGGVTDREMHELSRRWAAPLCVTRGASGATLFEAPDNLAHFPAGAVPLTDACGAGDCFSVSVVTALAEGKALPRAVELAVAAATDYVGQPAVAGVGGESTGAPAVQTLWGSGA